MNDLNHIIASVLNVSPSQIESICTSLLDSKKTLYVTFKKDSIHCPFCDSSSLLSNGFYKRKVYLPHYALDNLISMFITADIEEYKEFTTLLQNWKREIINSFSHYRGKRINNSVAESLNAKVSTLLFNTKGIRNNERRRKRIMYTINKEGFIIK